MQHFEVLLTRNLDYFTSLVLLQLGVTWAQSSSFFLVTLVLSLGLMMFMHNEGEPQRQRHRLQEREMVR